jgi:hypothetical protein
MGYIDDVIAFGSPYGGYDVRQYFRND